MGERLCHFSRHDAILLLRHSFSIPRLLYLLRTAPAFLAPSLVEYDTLSCSLLSSITNVLLSSDSLTWIQASLPVKYGSLGFRSAVQLHLLVFFHLLLPHRNSPLKYFHKVFNQLLYCIRMKLCHAGLPGSQIRFFPQVKMYAVRKHGTSST